MSSDGTIISFDTQDECEGFWVGLGCSGSGGAPDFEACADALPSADCDDSVAGAETFVLPAACN